MSKKRLYKWQDGKELVLDKDTLVMGILNGTPDSFSDGGKYNNKEAAVLHAKELERDGAAIIDVGVESTRPGHTKISVEEEIKRMKEVLIPVIKSVNAPVSVDTYRYETAEFALANGANILNDIWGLQYDDQIANVAAKYQVPVVIMHNQNDTNYGDIIVDIKKFFAKSIEIAKRAGIKEENIILDPGFGFGKTAEQNIELMKRLDEFRDLKYPLLIGTSRKRFIGEMLDGLASLERDEGTVTTCVVGALAGAMIVRVHNAKMVARAIKVVNRLKI